LLGEEEIDCPFRASEKSTECVERFFPPYLHENDLRASTGFRGRFLNREEITDHAELNLLMKNYG